MIWYINLHRQILIVDEKALWQVAYRGPVKASFNYYKSSYVLRIVGAFASVLDR